MKSTLTLRKFRLMVKLGWSEQERLKEQPVDIDIDIQFPTPPEACSSDRLDETVCYSTLCEHLRQFCESRSFRLIEFLSAELHREVKSAIGTGRNARIAVTKVHPPVIGLEGGASFVYGDF